MRIVGLDPAKPERRGPRSRKPGLPKAPVWAELGTWGPPKTWVGGPPEHDPDNPIDLLVCELPYPHGPAGKKSLINMGLWAGFLLDYTAARVKVAMPATVWKELLIPRFGTARKEVFCNNARQLLKLPKEWDPIKRACNPNWDRHQDLIDACSLAHVGTLLSPKLIQQYKVEL